MGKTYYCIESYLPSAFVRMAIKMDVKPIEALRMRYRYLKSYMEDMKSLCLQFGACDPYFWWWIDAARELHSLIQYAKKYKKHKPRTNEITDDMIRAAAEYPINQIVEFIRGKSLAFCHDDHTPSAFYGNRTNTLICPVCDKKFNPIQVLRLRDGMSFADAVRYLQ